MLNYNCSGGIVAVAVVVVAVVVAVAVVVVAVVVTGSAVGLFTIYAINSFTFILYIL